MAENTLGLPQGCHKCCPPTLAACWMDLRIRWEVKTSLFPSFSTQNARTRPPGGGGAGTRQHFRWGCGADRATALRAVGSVDPVAPSAPPPPHPPPTPPSPPPPLPPSLSALGLLASCWFPPPSPLPPLRALGLLASCWFRVRICVSRS